MNRTTTHTLVAFTTALLLAPLAPLDAAEDKPTQTSLAAALRPEAGLTREQRIQWWREARFGMFIHWGLYSIPAGVWKDKVHATGYSEWIMFAEKIPAKEYELLAGRFNPVKFDAKAWAAIAKKAGMKYMVLTAKHHDGFSMFRSRLTPYNVADATPFKRDVTRELSDACRDSGIRFGCYYSIDRDWYRPQGPGNNYRQNNVWDFPDSKKEDFDRYFAGFAKPQVEELLTNYRPDLLWFDEIDMKSDAQVEDLYQAIRKLRPECIVNSRIKTCSFPDQIPPRHCDYITSGDNEILAKAQKKSTGSPVDIRFTAKGNSIYAICLAWPQKDVLVRALGNKGVPDKTIAAVNMLGSKDEVKWRQTDDGLTLSVPREKPCRYAFVYRIDFKKE